MVRFLGGLYSSGMLALSPATRRCVRRPRRTGRGALRWANLRGPSSHRFRCELQSIYETTAPLDTDLMMKPTADGRACFGNQQDTLNQATMSQRLSLYEDSTVTRIVGDGEMVLFEAPDSLLKIPTAEAKHSGSLRKGL